MKKAVSVFLSLIMILSAFAPLSALADDSLVYFERGVLTDGSSTAYYVIDMLQKYLYISGDGINNAVTPDYPSADEGPFSGRNDITRIIIEEDVAYVGNYVFANMKSVDTVEIQTNLFSDEYGVSSTAFSNDTAIRNVQGNSSVLSLNSLKNAISLGTNIATGNWLGVIKTVISGGSSALSEDGVLDDESVDAMVNDYITTGETVYFGSMDAVIEGYEERTSSPCYYGNTYNHGYIVDSEIEPTCTEEGKRVYRCFKCNDTYEEPIAPKGHSYTQTVLYPAQCTVEGIMKYQCADCGSYYYGEIDPAGHTPVPIPDIAPTCTGIGYADGVKCGVCGEILTPAHEVERVAHSYSYTYEDGAYIGTCTECGDTVTAFDSDISALLAAVDYAKSFSENDYSTESYAVLYEAYSPYSELTADDASSFPQSVADEKAGEILSAVSQLVPYLKLVIGSTKGSVSYEINLTESSNTVSQILFGTVVTVKTEPKNNSVFYGWFDTKANRYVSYNSEYSFVMTANTSLRADYSAPNEATLMFASPDGEIVKRIFKTREKWNEVSSVSDLAPAVPYMFGYVNGEWIYDENEVLSKLRSLENVIITAEYEPVETALSEKPVSVDGEPAVKLDYILDEGSSVGVFAMSADIPTSARIATVAVAFYNGEAGSFNPAGFDLSVNNKTLVSKFDPADINDLYIVNVMKFTSKYNWAVRGYVSYYDNNNELKTVYTNQINIVNRAIV